MRLQKIRISAMRLLLGFTSGIDSLLIEHVNKVSLTDESYLT